MGTAVSPDRPDHLFTIAIKVIPGAPGNRIIGRRGDELVVKIVAPPEEGKANRELVSFLARTLEIAKSEITLVRGAASRHKVLALPVAVREKVAAFFPALGL